MNNYALTGLARLSIYRVGHRATPTPPTNEQRMRAFRMFAPVQFANTKFTPPASTPPDSPAGGAGTYPKEMK